MKVKRLKLENGNGKKSDSDIINGGRLCTVACKLPSGLVLQLYKMVDSCEQTLQGPRSIKVAERQPRKFIVNGNAPRRDGQPKLDGQGNPVLFVGDYALTPNVDAEFFAEWLKQHKDLDCVRNRYIFAFSKPEDVKAECKTLEGHKSGLEPLSPTQLDKHGDPVGAVDDRLRRGGARSVTTAEK